MRCPFLREEQVKSCQAAPFRMSLARTSARVDGERCSSPDYVACPMLRERHEAHPDPVRCPFLRESLSQFCAVAPAASYVPWSDSPELRCAHDGHRFCSVFLETRGADARRPESLAPDALEARTEHVSGVPVPGWLYFSDAHLWLDVGEDGIGHVGMDAFVAQLLGEVEALAFPAVKGTVVPSVTLTVRGVELTLRFPAPLTVLAANTRLRARLERLTADPYGLGWLLEVRLSPDWQSEGPARAGMRRGVQAQEWMAGEVRRVSEWVHEHHLAGGGFAADGGRFAPELLHRLPADDVPRVLSTIFASPEIRRTT